MELFNNISLFWMLGFEHCNNRVRQVCGFQGLREYRHDRKKLKLQRLVLVIFVCFKNKV